jgi:hypothetical protein
MDQLGAFENTVINLLVSQNVWKFLSGCKTGGFLRRVQLLEASYYYYYYYYYY